MSESDYDAIEAVVRGMIVEAAYRLEISPYILTAKIEQLLEAELERRGSGPNSGEPERNLDPLEIAWLTALKSQAPDASENDLCEIVQELFARLVDALERDLASHRLH